MIISRVPLRISFLGGGTDYPEYFREFGGATLVTTIDRYCHVTVHPLGQFQTDNFRIHYSKVESVKSLDEIQHPSARECLRHLKIDGGVEVHYVNDLPARTGLASSSAATVALLIALNAFRGKIVSRQQIAQDAIFVEQELIKERVGCQDQFACTFGGLSHLEFLREGPARVNPVPLSKERLGELESHLLLLYTGVQRTADEVLDEQIKRTKSGDITEHLGKLKELVARGIEVLASGRDIREFGELLHEGWELKRLLSSKISNPTLDAQYARARTAGAIGGKLLGAGGGGFLLLLVPPTAREDVKRQMPELLETKFNLEGEGSTLMFYRS